MNLILCKVLQEQDLNTWSKLKRDYFQPPYTLVYDLIAKFYETYGKIPSFKELEIVTRSEKDLNTIRAIQTIKIPEDLNADIILQATVNEYAQNEVLSKLYTYLDELPFKETFEIIEDLNSIAIELEEKTESAEQIVMMNDISIIDENELSSRVYLGINNTFDSHSLGLAPTELIMFGGFRGSGKSVVCSNLVCNQYLQDKPSLYFSIEMRGREVIERNLAILSEVPMQRIKSGKLTDEDKDALIKTRASMVVDGEELVEKYKETKDFKDIERKILERPLKENRIITIDNNSLTLSNIDATVGKFKSRHGDDLKVVVVDYINQITIDQQYDWKTQIYLSKKLKEIGRKYEVIMAVPFQIDAKGEVRFSKGILDSCDWAFNLEASKETNTLSFHCKKVRGSGDISFASPIDWNCLKISPHGSEIAAQTADIKGSKREQGSKQKGADDL